MSRVIYIDLLIASNTLVNFLLISVTERLLQTGASRRALFRQAVAALIGGLSSCAIFMESDLMVALIKFVVAAAMVLLSFGGSSGRFYVKALAVFWGVSTLFAGLMMLVYTFFSPPGMVMENGYVYFNLSPLTFVLAALLCYLISLLLCTLLQNKLPLRENQVYRVVIRMEDKTAELRGRVDSGNDLLEPFSGRPVAVCAREAVEAILPGELLHAVQVVLGGGNASATARGAIRVLPFRTVAGDGMIPAIKPDSVELVDTEGNRFVTKPIYLGLCDEKMLPSDTKILLHPRMTEREAGSAAGRATVGR